MYQLLKKEIEEILTAVINKNVLKFSKLFFILCPRGPGNQDLGLKDYIAGRITLEPLANSVKRSVRLQCVGHCGL